jgi:hypothetical protein
MIQHTKPESVIDELHRIRREIADKFDGDVDAIAKDAAERLARSGRATWTPRVEKKADQPPIDVVRPADASTPARR